MECDVKCICITCVKDDVLRLQCGGKERQCSYCHCEGVTAPISSIACEVKAILDELYMAGSSTDKPAIKVIRDLNAIPTRAAEDVQDMLREQHEFDFHDFYLDVNAYQRIA